MPPLEQNQTSTLQQWVVLLVLVGSASGLLIWGVIIAPSAFWVLGPAVALYGFVVFRSGRYWRKLRQARQAESICAFARNLPARSHDPWVVRAVYEGLSAERGVSVRPEDRLERNLGFLPEDLDDCLVKAAHRAGRSLSDCSKNPWAGKVITVADAVAFLEQQPRLENTKAAYP